MKGRYLQALIIGLLVAAALVVSATAGSPPSPGVVGFVGCSNTRGAVLGYEADSGQDFWAPTSTTYDSGALPRWTYRLPSNTYWSQLASMNAAKPGATSIWLEICLYASMTASQGEQAAGPVIAELHRRFPNATVYVSALNGYSDHVCTKVGADGSTKIAAVYQWTLAYTDAQPGPVMPALSWATTISDGCHPNAAGQRLLGTALLDFFGTSTSPPPPPPPPPVLSAGPQLTSFTPMSGAAGTRVTITGSGLVGVTSVSLVNGSRSKQAVFTADSDSQITAVVPALPVGATGRWRVTSPAGSATSAASYLVTG